MAVSCVVPVGRAISGGFRYIEKEGAAETRGSAPSSWLTGDGLRPRGLATSEYWNPGLVVDRDYAENEALSQELAENEQGDTEFIYQIMLIQLRYQQISPSMLQPPLRVR